MLMRAKDVYNMDETSLFIIPNQTRQRARKSFWAQNSKGPSHSCSCCKHDMHLFTNLYAQDALGGDCQQIMCGNSQTKWHGGHHVYLRFG